MQDCLLGNTYIYFTLYMVQFVENFQHVYACILLFIHCFSILFVNICPFISCIHSLVKHILLCNGDLHFKLMCFTILIDRKSCQLSACLHFSTLIHYVIQFLRFINGHSSLQASKIYIYALVRCCCRNAKQIAAFRSPIIIPCKNKIYKLVSASYINKKWTKNQ